jgi:hypothetical protein
MCPSSKVSFRLATLVTDQTLSGHKVPEPSLEERMPKKGWANALSRDSSTICWGVGYWILQDMARPLFDGPVAQNNWIIKF